VGLAFALGGCSLLRTFASPVLHSVVDPIDLATQFKLSQEKFTNHVRWGQFDEASEFVETELRNEYRLMVREFSEIRLTDSITHSLEIDRLRASGTAVVEYSGYWLARPQPYQIEVVRHWRRETRSGRWYVSPEIDRIRDKLRSEGPVTPS
jgi:hypothetical protein